MPEPILAQSSNSMYEPIPKAEHSERVQLSYAQSRLWFLEQLVEKSPWYLVPLSTRVRGPIDLDALRDAFWALQIRHETLRTTFEMTHTGAAIQVIHEPRRELRIIDAGADRIGYEKLRDQEWTTPFDLTREPGFRVSLIKLGPDDHVLTVVMHHIISDFWSTVILRKELARFYSAGLNGLDPLMQIDPLPIQYRDFAVWQREEKQVVEQRKQLEYWTKHLEGSMPAEFLLDRARPDVLTGEAGVMPFVLDPEVYKDLRAFCQTYHVTTYVATLAAFRAAHYRLTGSEDAGIGTSIANRTRLEVENLIGFFVNTQCMRIAVDDRVSFKDLVQQVHLLKLAAVANQDVPFEQIVTALCTGPRDASRNPLVQVGFTLHFDTFWPGMELEGAQCDGIPPPPLTRFDIEVHLIREKNGLSGILYYSSQLFDPETIQGLITVFCEILRQALRDPEAAVATLPLTGYELGVQETNVTDYPRDSSIVDAFRQQATATPAAVAVKDSGSMMTYAELDRQSDLLSKWLHQRNLPAEHLVGVLAPRSCEAVVAFLGILKSNLAYLPLDINSPLDHTESILAAVRGERILLLGTDVHALALQSPMVKLARIVDILQAQAMHQTLGSCTQSLAKPCATSLAYVIFTSGSTGKPKGVMIEHRGVVRLAKQSATVDNLPKCARVAHVSNIAFDPSIFEIYMAILNGGTLICLDYMTTLDIQALGCIFVDEKINTAVLSPALFKLCLSTVPDALKPLKLLYVGGDRLDPRIAVKGGEIIEGAIYNAYGPTENTVLSTYYLLGDDKYMNGVPIGSAASNSGAWVMDSMQQLVPNGVIGELVVTGDGLARGYTDPTLDLHRFVHIQVGGETLRAYRTGDRVRRRPRDGQIEFFGRMNLQIKIRGQRVELAEVEQTILRQHGVDDVAVLAHKHDDGEVEMIAFVKADDGGSDQLHVETEAHVTGWGDLFEQSTYAETDAKAGSEIGRDFIEWKSMIDGKAFDKAEMHEWLDDIMQVLSDNQPLGHVFEIGTGAGMILFNLGDGLQSYVGLEPSMSATAFVNDVIKSNPDLSTKAQVFTGTATDINMIQEKLRPDVVVVNSVAQYLPSLEYLTEVVEALSKLPTVKRLIFGDMRSYPLHREFLAARALYDLGDNATKAAISKRISELGEAEEELLVDPFFFSNLTVRFRDRVKLVQILPKKMVATNELSAYRYTAVVHMHNPETADLVIHDVRSDTCLDFKASGMDQASLLDLLQNSTGAEMIAVSNVPYSKTNTERHIVAALDNDENPGQIPGDRASWILDAKLKAQSCCCFSPMDLVQLGKEAAFQVEVSWARQRSQNGALDVVFYRVDTVEAGKCPLFQFPMEKLPHASELFANQPLRRSVTRHAETAIRLQLQDQLPQYMIPARIVVLDRLPINANGKVDRKALARKAETAASGKTSTIRIAPTNDLEALLCTAFADVLKVEVGTADNFFALGGHSLIATKLASRIGRQLNVPMSVKKIFDYPVVADLARNLQGSDLYVPIPLMRHDQHTELSYAQSRLWFLDQLGKGSTQYHMQLTTRLRGRLNIDALSAALRELEQRHEPLRTTFKEWDGLAVQVVHAKLCRDLRVVDVTIKSYPDVLEQETTTGFDLEIDPSFRPVLLRLSDDDHILSIVMHHIISDGWSLDVLRKDLAKLYKSMLPGESTADLIPLPIQYRDFAKWQKQDKQVAKQDKQLLYWIDQLEGAIPAELLTDRTRPDVLSGSASVMPFTIEDELYQSLMTFCKTHQVTPFVTLLATFRAAHYRLTGVEDACLGSPIANRNRPELENLIGFFVNTQCMRIRVGENDSFEDLVLRARRIAVDAFENQDVPFERIVSVLLPGSRDTSRNPLVQLMFAVHAQEGLGGLELEGLTSEVISRGIKTRFDIEFHILQKSHGFGGAILFSDQLFEIETIGNVLAIFQEVLVRGLDDPKALIGIMSLAGGLPELHRKALLDVKTSSYARNSSVIDVFCEQVAICPHSIAVKDSSSQLTYSELDQKSENLAIWLRRQGFVPESIIGVLAPRSCETIVAFFGILKANLAYLPLDVNVPLGRVRTIMSAVAGPKLVMLGGEVSTSENELPGVKLVRIRDALCSPSHRAGDPATILPVAGSLAYVMFTSGSTGIPKGVMVEHRSILRLVQRGNVVDQLPRRCRFAHLSNIAFDASILEVYAALLNQGTVVCIDYFSAIDTTLLGCIFQEERIQAAFFPNALLKRCLLSPKMCKALESLEVLYVGGERFDTRDAIEARSLVRGRAYHVYGPTENTVFSMIYPLEEGDTYVNGVPIGQPISNSGAYIMDAQQNLCPLGVVGELVVVGDGLARGYLDSRRDKDHFILVSIDGRPHVRAYRTGDRARYRPRDGQVEFFGRADLQIKIRGHRIELAEVEKSLLCHNAVCDATVVLRDGPDDEREMVGFVATRVYESMPTEETASQVQDWGNHFELSTYTDISSITDANLGNDFVGWTSMYNDKAIPKVEMLEWLDDTMRVILDGRPAGHVLEIGTGTGMVLFNLGRGLQNYVGFDPSPSAIAFVNDAVKSSPGLANKVDVRVGTAADVRRLGELGLSGTCIELVVINSVAQYFPTAEYLAEVVETLLHLPGVKQIFFGDMRSYPLNKSFLAARALYALGDSVTKDDILQKMTELEEHDDELLVDPEFFTSLPTRFRDLIRHVEILPKKMKATNELSTYRYAAVVHVANTNGHGPTVHAIDPGTWLDFERSQLDRSGLTKLLIHASDSSIVAISNIPDSRTIRERCIVESLGGGTRVEEDGAWISEAWSRADGTPSFSAFELVEVGKEANFLAEVSWARQASQRGGLDVVFHRVQPPNEGSRVMFQFPTDATERPLRLLTNHPFRQLRRRLLASQIRAAMQENLPSYMVPVEIIVLDELPTNTNGKVDRKALARRAQITRLQARVYEAPHTQLEIAICEEFARVLGVGKVGLTSNFFDLGGHSLMATKLTTCVNRRLDVRLSVKDIFDRPVVKDLARTIVQGSELHRPICPTPYRGPTPLSYAQGRLWFLDQLIAGSTWYLMPFAWRLHGPLQLDALNRALQALEQRHEILRTTFEENEGQGVQIVHERCFDGLRLVDLTAEKDSCLNDILRREQTTPFDLKTQPGLRVCIIQLGTDDFILSLVMHHIVSDGWSIDVLRKDLGELYRASQTSDAPRLEALPIQYRDFAAWQKEPEQLAQQDKQLDYWIKQLIDSKPAELPIDKVRPDTPSGKAGYEPFTIDTEIYQALQEYCRVHQVTAFIVLLAVFRATHHRLTDAEDATIGTPIANRNRPELEKLIGFFVNMQCMRITITNETFEALVQQVRSTATTAFANQDVPFERIVTALTPGSRDTSRNPLVQLSFALYSQEDFGRIHLESISDEPMMPDATTRMDAEFHLFQKADSLSGGVMFALELFEVNTIRNMLSVFGEILRRGLKSPDVPVATMPLTDGLPEVESNERLTNSVPIGSAISHSGVYVMDARQSIVPVGVMGDLVVTGDGLARVYADPTMDTDRFVEVTINKQQVRAYRTGDRARYRPRDRKLELFGRIDQQVKIRGHRIELGDVEQAILRDRIVQDAAVILREQAEEQPELFGFVTLHTDQSDQQDTASGQVEARGNFFEPDTYRDLQNMERSRISNDFTGWTSMYDGSTIDRAEMQEWLDDTIGTIQAVSSLGHVLEIGTRTGMVLFNLGKGLQSYVGIEPSKTAVAFVNHAIQTIPELTNRAEVHLGTAADIHQLCTLQTNLAVMNSVVQYFPSSEYLMDTLEALVRLPNIKQIFLGDVRSYATNRYFFAGMTVRALGDQASKQDVRKRMQALEEQDEELLVDPAFFFALTSRCGISDKIEHVEILPKRMKATNELSSYRYTAILHVRRSDKDQPLRLHTIDTSAWLDFTASGMDRIGLADLLETSKDALTVAVSNIPYSKISSERHLLRSLDIDEDDAEGKASGSNISDELGSTVTPSWIEEARSRARRSASLSATDLVEMAEKSGFRVEISWARQRSQHGAMDAVFHHIKMPDRGDRVMIKFPTDEEGRALESLTNRPLRRSQARRIEAQIRERLKKQVPSYMVPSKILILDRMPINASGKVDRKALTKRAQEAVRSTPTAARVVPRTELEKTLCAEFETVLGCKVSMTDNFFDAGGHSLMAMKLTAGISSRLGVEVAVKEVFDHPVVADLAQVLANRILQSDRIDRTGFSDAPAYERFSLCTGVDIHALAYELDLPATNKIIDVCPATDTQSYWVALNTMGSFVAHLRFDRSEGYDADRLRQACTELIASSDVLRTVFVFHGGQMLQVILDCLDQLPFSIHDTPLSVDTYTATLVTQYHTSRSPSLGQPLVHISLIRSHHSPTQRLLLSISHALYDFLSLPPLITRLFQLLHTPTLALQPQAPFGTFLSSIRAQTSPATTSYWRDLVHTAPRVPLKPAYRSSATPARHVALPVVRGYTPAMLVKAAWAYALSRVTGVRDVLFSEYKSGAAATALAVGGCTMGLVPVRVRLETGWTGRDLLRCVREQQLEAEGKEGVGWREVERWTGRPWGGRVNHHSIEVANALLDRREMQFVPPVERWGEAVELESIVERDGLRLWLYFAKEKLNAEEAEDLLAELGEVIGRLGKETDAILDLNDRKSAGWWQRLTNEAAREERDGEVSDTDGVAHAQRKAQIEVTHQEDLEEAQKTVLSRYSGHEDNLTADIVDLAEIAVILQSKGLLVRTDDLLAEDPVEDMWRISTRN